MSRPPEITEKESIDAGIAIESDGNNPNPSSIRVELKNKGTLIIF